jgi:AAA15 family ATPase/GTPase
MLKSLKIENFRGFESFELKQLGRINLLVGENNSGKTSALEAMLLLISRLNFRPIFHRMMARGELLVNARKDGEIIDLRYLFYEYTGTEEGISLSVEGDYTDNTIEKITLEVKEIYREEYPGQWHEEFDLHDGLGALSAKWSMSETQSGKLLHAQDRMTRLEFYTGLPVQYTNSLQKKLILLRSRCNSYQRNLRLLAQCSNYLKTFNSHRKRS